MNENNTADSPDRSELLACALSSLDYEKTKLIDFASRAYDKTTDASSRALTEAAEVLSRVRKCISPMKYSVEGAFWSTVNEVLTLVDILFVEPNESKEDSNAVCHLVHEIASLRESMPEESMAGESSSTNQNMHEDEDVEHREVVFVPEPIIEEHKEAENAVVEEQMVHPEPSTPSQDEQHLEPSTPSQDRPHNDLEDDDDFVFVQEHDYTLQSKA
mmetsp:Transcript_24878/g.40958  ORF Transcript_24878/g.40958 Transcript_24878/m.40958 type:complete len:216 (+) Transcript_24878:160-807(+)|eukprot:CAMPEP_0184646122 /NCGR_PEP_ID=MMETSP0308-20130426/2762_1 /TAXON_ID=38269 /ORGANISM="Gloeochaete witrockiana, Strain SAG 46.84" /LENGTH=215 /DNA_ID=CAMNT_0027075823 /DNA_START=145 /DNA_END=792 /DNA_ORIENTATION=-